MTTSNVIRYQRIAPFYDVLDLPFERRRYRALRPLLFRGLAGRLLDAGIGTGRNCEFYPPGDARARATALPHARIRGPALSDGRDGPEVSGGLIRRGSCELPVLCAARRSAGARIAGDWARRCAGWVETVARIRPPTR